MKVIPLLVVALRQFRHPQFDRWLAALPVAVEIADGINYLSERGRGSVLPDVRTHPASRHFPDMSEVRTDQAVDGRRFLMRVLTCFADADTTVVVCLGGNNDRYENRTGRDCYEDYVPAADLIVDHNRSKGEFR